MGGRRSLALFAKLLLLPPDERYSVAGLTPAREREETFRALREWLLARTLASDRSYSSWRTCTGLTRRAWSSLRQFISEGAHDRILTVLTFRPEFKTPWPALAHQTNFGPQSANTAASSRVDAKKMRAKCCRRRWSRKSTTAHSGVPLLVEEFSRLARESAVFEPATIASSPARRRARENCRQRCRSS